MSKNICMTGSQGTGKTTLRESIMNILPELKILPGTVRSLIKEGVLTLDDINQNAGPDVQNMLFFAQCKKHEEFKDTDYISDRCSIDVLAYTLWMLEKNNVGGGDYNMYYDQYDKLKEIISRGFIKTIFYIPIEFDIVSDDVRVDDKDFQREIDNNIRFIISQLVRDTNVDIYEITGTVEERTQQVLNIYNK